MSSVHPAIAAFLTKIGITDGSDRKQVIQLVQDIAEIPWGEGRTIEEVLETKHVGTCTGKHLVLAACCDALSVAHRTVVCTFKWSEQGIVLPKNLEAILQEGEWLHGHNFLQLQSSTGEWIDVDVTWDSALKPYGFRTFPSDWNGETSFVGVQNMQGRTDNADINKKKEWLAALSPETQQRRERFLHGFFVWIETLRH